MLKNQKGITLIALVITIIVLLILAGVSIAMLTGDNGLLTRANETKISTVEGQLRDAITLAVSELKIDQYDDSVTDKTKAATTTANIVTKIKAYDSMKDYEDSLTAATATTITVTAEGKTITATVGTDGSISSITHN